MFTMNDILDIAVKMEKNGKTIYSQAMDKTTNKELKSLLQWMADEEDSHEKWFLMQKDILTHDQDSKDLTIMLPDILQEMMGEKSLSLDDVDFSKITTPTQMLETFIEFENDTILFYEFLETFIEGRDTLAGLKKIIQEETSHVKKLNLMIQAI
jgi:rubrerythrin